MGEKVGRNNLDWKISMYNHILMHGVQYFENYVTKFYTTSKSHVSVIFLITKFLFGSFVCMIGGK